MRLRPFWPYFGAKHSSANHYPAPRYRRIVEPLAGSAGFSSRYWRREIVLCDRDPVIAGLWRWLIDASPSDVLDLPDVQPGQCIADLGLPPAAAALVGFWQGRGIARPRLSGSRSDWATTEEYADQFWGEAVRQRIAGQLAMIRHWQIIEGDYRAVNGLGPATWFVDAPYRKRAGNRYRFGADAIDYTHLADWCRALPGQVIVCEGAGADWLPFRDLGVAFTRMTTRERAGEMVWTSDDAEQLRLVV